MKQEDFLEKIYKSQFSHLSLGSVVHFNGGNVGIVSKIEMESIQVISKEYLDGRTMYDYYGVRLTKKILEHFGFEKCENNCEAGPIGEESTAYRLDDGAGDYIYVVIGECKKVVYKNCIKSNIEHADILQKAVYDLTDGASILGWDIFSYESSRQKVNHVS